MDKVANGPCTEEWSIELEKKVDSIFSRSKTSEGEEDAKQWCRALPLVEQELLDEGVDYILKGGLCLAARRSFDTLIRQKQENRREGNQPVIDGSGAVASSTSDVSKPQREKRLDRGDRGERHRKRNADRDRYRSNSAVAPVADPPFASHYGATSYDRSVYHPVHFPPPHPPPLPPPPPPPAPLYPYHPYDHDVDPYASSWRPDSSNNPRRYDDRDRSYHSASRSYDWDGYDDRDYTHGRRDEYSRSSSSFYSRPAADNRSQWRPHEGGGNDHIDYDDGNADALYLHHHPPSSRRSTDDGDRYGHSRSSSVNRRSRRRRSSSSSIAKEGRRATRQPIDSETGDERDRNEGGWTNVPDHDSRIHRRRDESENIDRIIPYRNEEDDLHWDTTQEGRKESNRISGNRATEKRSRRHSSRKHGSANFDESPREDGNEVPGFSKHRDDRVDGPDSSSPTRLRKSSRKSERKRHNSRRSRSRSLDNDSSRRRSSRRNRHRSYTPSSQSDDSSERVGRSKRNSDGHRSRRKQGGKSRSPSPSGVDNNDPPTRRRRSSRDPSRKKRRREKERDKQKK